MTMTTERIEELRRLGAGNLHTTGFGQYILECLEEIDRLRKIKPAPTLDQLIALAKDGVGQEDWYTRVRFIEMIKHAGLLAEPVRAPGWYWVIAEDAKTWEVAQWLGAYWRGATWGGKSVDRVGFRIHDPPAELTKETSPNGYR